MATVTAIPATKTRIHDSALSGFSSKRRVAAYARVSTDMEEQATSYQAQIDYYTVHIQSRADWVFAGMYADEGISGTSTKHREGFQAMIADALAGKIDLILTKSVSRFARNTVDSLTTVRQLKEAGVEVYFEKESIWTLDSKGELLITIMSSLAQEESRSISENVTWGHRRRFADGKVMVPYSSLLGYKKGADGNLAIDETQAPTVRLIYQLFLDGSSITEIRAELQRRGILTPRGKTNWSTSTVRSILTNEKYKGDALLQKTFTADFLTKRIEVNEGEVPQYYVTGNHEPIIDAPVWDQVQYELATRHATNSSKIGLFASRLKCADCGSWYGRKTWASNTKYKHTIWRCNQKYDHPRPCQTATLRDEQIQTAFLAALNQLAEQYRGQSHLPQVIDSMFNTDQLEAESKRLDEKIRALASEIESLVAENQRVAQDQDQYLARYTQLEARYQKTLGRKQAIEAEIAAKSAKATAIKTAYTQLADKPIQHFQPSQWTALIDHAVIGANEIQFVFRIGTEITVPIASRLPVSSTS
ncbi:recombinase family protein [Corynebacterium sp. HMSC078H07]|uniref:recombinase family protein n=1 Tax=Corynebacterium sp. HMSC078H07 TaxID=1739379 RepID=UPI0008A14CA4|nr:recombinase family protein [Corynebacterium sp. HMSC078H07]OFR69625.1 recombinase [Corynebacterium sp. HMSC078H07]